MPADTRPHLAPLEPTIAGTICVSYSSHQVRRLPRTRYGINVQGRCRDRWRRGRRLHGRVRAVTSRPAGQAPDLQREATERIAELLWASG